MKLFGKKISIICMLLVLGSFASSHAAGTHLNIVYTDWFPYTYEEDGRAAGFEIDTCRMVLDRMGIAAEFKMYPWKRCLAYLEAGRVDAIISMLYTPARAVFAYFPYESISISRTVFFTTTDNPLQFDGTYGALKNTKVGVVMGFDYGEDFARANLNIDEARDVQALIIKLLEGRNDLVAENRIVAEAAARRMGVLDRLRFLEPPIHSHYLYVGFSRVRGHEHLCADFSRKLTEFKKTAAYQAILEKYSIDYSMMTVHPAEYSD